MTLSERMKLLGSRPNKMAIMEKESFERDLHLLPEELQISRAI